MGNLDVRVLVVGYNKKILLVLERGGVKTMPDGRSFEKPSRWGLPGGRSEASDGDEVDTALREVKEETGLSVLINEGLQSERKEDGYTKVVFVGYLDTDSKNKTIEINPEEILDCKWFPLDVLDDMKFNMYSGHRKMAKKLLQELR